MYTQAFMTTPLFHQREHREIFLIFFLKIKFKFNFPTANEVTCEEEDGHISYHPDKMDCSHYYMCEGERKHHMPCPANLVFNPNENVCDWPENVESCQHHTQAPPTNK